ncbi:type VI secretion system tube protein Hcp, partial [Citrobacter freundii]|nr:type VI secretion system tube protein Hcp [Citrobacter freundii]
HIRNLFAPSLRYEAITWKHCDGNIIYKDAWNHRVIS